MEIGNQIKQLRQRRGITQEEMAQHFGVTPQAVSKWERGAATPDIGLLPDLSAYFGVTIDDLFALSDETRMERIQNMLWDVRYLNQSDVGATREFLLEKAKREPSNGRPHELLADMENHIAREHMSYAAEYAKESLRRDPQMLNAYGELIYAMNGKIADWNGASHYALIDFLADYIQKHPSCRNAHLYIIDQLLDDYRVEEAKEYCDKLSAIDQTYRVSLYRGKIAWQEGKRPEAFAIWEEMEQKFPEEWCVYHNIGDYLLRDGQNEKVAAYYRKAIDIQAAPRYTDPFEALAQFYERVGDYASAIAILQEDLAVFDKEWHFTEGESADVIRREIARLEKKLTIRQGYKS